MRAHVISEFRKIRTTRTALGLLVGLLALSGLLVWGTMSSASPAELAAALSSPAVLAAVVVVVPVFVLVLGVRSFTDEIRYGSIVPTFLAVPERWRVLAAKVTVIAAASAGFSLAALVLGTGVATAYLSAEGAALAVEVGPLAALAGKVVLVGALWSVLGVAIGAIVRHQVAAIVGALAWALIAENVVSLVAPGIVGYLPGHATTAVVGMATDPSLLSPWVGAATLVGWVAAAVALGAVSLARRDVT